MKDDFAYQMQKFSEARSALMAPHPSGETVAFADAFHACYLGLHLFDKRRVTEEEPQRWLGVVERFLDTKGLEDPGDQGLYRVKAASLSVNEKAEFSKTVDELASYFSSCFWSAHP